MTGSSRSAASLSSRISARYDSPSKRMNECTHNTADEDLLVEKVCDGGAKVEKGVSAWCVPPDCLWHVETF